MKDYNKYLRSAKNTKPRYAITRFYVCLPSPFDERASLAFGCSTGHPETNETIWLVQKFLVCTIVASALMH